MIVEVFDPLRCSASVLWDGRPRRINTFNRFKSKPFGCSLFFSKHVCSHKKRTRGGTCPGAFSILVSKRNAPKQVVNSTTPAVSSPLPKRALMSFFWLLCQKLSKTNKEKLWCSWRTWKTENASSLIQHRKHSMTTCTKMVLLLFFTRNSELYKTSPFTFPRVTLTETHHTGFDIWTWKVPPNG